MINVFSATIAYQRDLTAISRAIFKCQIVSDDLNGGITIVQ